MFLSSQTSSAWAAQCSPRPAGKQIDFYSILKETKNNASVFKNELGIFNIGIYFFDYRECPLVKNKESPSDNGIEVWDEIVNKYIKNIKELREENHGI